jgi:glycosyltransferase involved in cell wall biosynthesis
VSGAFGVVVVGRNEAERLPRCLASLAGATEAVVYADSGSSDGSPDVARSLGVRVVELDAALPFTAARGRNAGFECLVREWPDVEFVQFVDGDCEVQPGWLATAASRLAADPALGAVCGRRRERHPERSTWNRLADLEWDTPVGEASAFGGDVMVRAAVLREVGGYRSDMIAGEDTASSGWAAR